MKLNLGCGERRLEGFVNIDAVSRGGRPPDIVADIRKIPLPDECADEVLAVHVVEHIAKRKLPGVLKEWRRLLKPNGLLVLELPNLIKCCQNIIALHEGRKIPGMGKNPEQCGLWGLFSDPSHEEEDEWMVHRWGYSPESLTAVLLENGFGSVRECETRFHNAGRGIRDMRIEARKTANG